jgi:hypothetical protein
MALQLALKCKDSLNKQFNQPARPHLSVAATANALSSALQMDVRMPAIAPEVQPADKLMVTGNKLCALPGWPPVWVFQANHALIKRDLDNTFVSKQRDPGWQVPESRCLRIFHNEMS